MCGTPHKGITRYEAVQRIEAALTQYRKFLGDMSQEPNIADLDYCSFCGNDHRDFSPAAPGETAVICIIEDPNNAS
jgi:recombinational DNA repair protein RecR